MKKIGKMIRFLSSCVIVFVVLIYICQFLFKALWKFDILNAKSYQIMYEYWEKGGVFNTFRDCSLGFSLIALPIVWLILSSKLYKYGLGKFLGKPFLVLYRRLTRPKTMEIEHVSIKNLGEKDKSLDEIIKEKMAKDEKNISRTHETLDIRKQIAVKIEENEKQ